MGWWRLIKLYRAQIIRLSSPAQCIAANMAGGAAMSFTPFFGAHIFAAMGFAWLIGARVSIIAATVGTFIGNPWTFPILLYTSYSVGKWVLIATGLMTFQTHINPDMVEQHADGLWQFLSDNFNDVFIPTALGGVIMAIISWPIYYYLFLYLVRGAQRARKLRMAMKQRKTFNRSARMKRRKK